MTSADRSEPPQPQYADRAFRSPLGFTGGVLLLAIGVWMASDAVLHGTGRTPWLALSGLLLAAPLVIAFTVRPVVYAGTARMLVRNPFRTVTIPWGAVEAVQCGYSSEVLAGGRTYQLWSIPVSLRARNKALRRSETTAAADLPVADQAVHQLRDLAQRHAQSAQAQGEVTTRWAYEIIATAAVGAVLLTTVWTVG